MHKYEIIHDVNLSWVFHSFLCCCTFTVRLQLTLEKLSFEHELWSMVIRSKPEKSYYFNSCKLLVKRLEYLLQHGLSPVLYVYLLGTRDGVFPPEFQHIQEICSICSTFVESDPFRGSSSSGSDLLRWDKRGSACNQLWPAFAGKVRSLGSVARSEFRYNTSERKRWSRIQKMPACQNHSVFHQQTNIWSAVIVQITAGYCTAQGLWEKFHQGIRRPIPGPLNSGALVEICVACLYSNQDIDQTGTILRFRNRLIIILATRPITRGPLKKLFAPLGKMCWTYFKLFKTIGHSFKKLRPSQKTLRPTWCPKLIADLIVLDWL